MSDSEKTAFMANPLFPATRAGNNMAHHWFDAVNTGIRSMGQLLDLSNNMFRSMARQQNDAMEVYLNTITGKPESTGQTAARKELKTGTAVVTGGTGGLGTEICKRLAGDGNRIVSTYIAAEEEQAQQWKKQMETEGFEVDLFECDVTDFDQCREVAQAIENKYGPVDVLVNCAGITRDGLLKKMDEADWHAVLDTNLDSVFNVTRNFIDGMLKNGYGRIVNISSVNGQKGQFGQTNYSSAKAGMIGFSRSLALELADTGITVNCVCPGYVATAMVEAIREDILEGIVAQIPMGRLAKPVEIADAVAFLAGRNSGYITGTELAVNGGLWLG
ncbi:MAG: acetoacetyl-CoA reductase [Gammaproteobacteria bacterium]